MFTSIKNLIIDLRKKFYFSFWEHEILLILYTGKVHFANISQFQIIENRNEKKYIYFES